MKFIEKALLVALPKIKESEIIFDYCPSQFNLEVTKVKKCRKDKDCRKCWNRIYKEN